MKRTTPLLLLCMLLATLAAQAQSTDDLLRLLTAKGAISEKEADSIRRDYYARMRRADATADSFPLRLGRSLDLSGYTQSVYQNFQHPGKYYDGFSIKRARLDFQGHFGGRFDYRLLVDFAGSTGSSGTAPTGGALISPALIDANITYKPFHFLQVKAGQMYVAFSLENLTQDRNLDLIERSQVVNALVARKGDAAGGLVDSVGNQNGRDIGIQAGGSLIRLKDAWLVDYTVQVLNGAGLNTPDNNPSKDIDARLVFHPLKIVTVAGSYYNGLDRFTSSPARDQKRTRWGTEAAVNYSGVTFKGEYIRGQEGGASSADHGAGAGLIVHEGWYGQLAWFFLPHRLQAVVRYDYYDPDTAKRAVKSTWYDVGLNYFFNVWTKVQVYYSLRSRQNAAPNNNFFEAQLQLAF
ncbi:MAG TPA: porin [Puia sp.]|nr:porin [Puia sp.]